MTVWHGECLAYRKHQYPYHTDDLSDLLYRADAKEGLGRFMDERDLNGSLQAEYLHLQKVIEDFDSRAVTIKAWSVTSSMVTLAAAFIYCKPVLFLISVASACLFWYLEFLWKQFQWAYYARARVIEDHFAVERNLMSPLVQVPFQIGRSWNDAYRAISATEKRMIASWQHVMLPHVFLAIAGSTLFASTMIGILNL